MSDIEILPCCKLSGELSVPGDKSISHRLALLAAMAEGTTQLANFSTSADCQSTLDCLRALGVRLTLDKDDRVAIEGRGLFGLERPMQILDAGNSGSTIRMLSGLLAGHSFLSIISGDASLSKRPMGRIIEPLSMMGAHIEAREQKYPPLRIQGGHLHGISYSLPVPSAQVKSALLLAGLLAEGETVVHESAPTRNHTEIALREFGVNLVTASGSTSIKGGQRLSAGEFEVPGDPSSAAFWTAAALLVPEGNLTLRSVGLNPSRSYFYEFLQGMGADIQLENLHEHHGERIGDIVVRSSELEEGSIMPSQVPALIDEIPILAVIGARSKSGLSVRGAQELRVKESDRIHAIVSNLRALGARVEEFEDGFDVPGNQRFRGGDVDTFDDHRIAMAFSVAALVADCPVTIHKAECVRISYPTFFEVLDKLRS